MGFRFSRRINLFPGLTLNLSGSGVSATVGVPGANFNISQRGVYGTAGIPGSGLRYRTPMVKFPNERSPQDNFDLPAPAFPEFSPYSFERAGKDYKSKEGDLTSFNLRALQTMIVDHRNQVGEAKVNVLKLNGELARAKRKRLLFAIISLGFLFAQRRSEVADNISDIEQNIAFESELASSEGIKFVLPPGTAAEQAWNEFTEIFRDLAGSHFIWDISSILENDLSYRRTTRSNAANSYERNRVDFVLSKSGIFETDIWLAARRRRSPKSSTANWRQRTLASFRRRHSITRGYRRSRIVGVKIGMIRSLGARRRSINLTSTRNEIERLSG